MKDEALTRQRLHDLFTYSDGVLLNKTVRRSHIKVGSPAGHQTQRGYINIRVDGRVYKAHRLIFLFHHGLMPDLIDHIDCDRTNNRIENLRACSKSQNGMNRAGSYGNAASRNVYKRGNKFQVHMKREGKPHYVGTFNSLDEANAAAVVARAQLFGEFA
jgi:hypothetical protein